MLTVIVPVYNSEKFIRRCIESIQNQTFSDLEIIIINDGSTDKSLQICQEIASNDKRVYVIDQENMGVSVARNIGLHKATGDYITFVDSDDCIESDMYELLMDSAKKYGADVAHCGYKRIEQDFIKEVNGTHKVYFQTNVETINYMLSGKLYNCGLWNKVFRREVLEGLVFEEGLRINEDVLFCFFALQQASKCVFIDETKYLYYVHSSSVCNSTDSLKKLKDTRIVSEKMLYNCKYDDNRAILEDRLFYCCLRINRWYLFHPDEAQIDQKKNEREKLKQLYKSFRNTRSRARLNYYLLEYFRLPYRFFFMIYDKLRKPNWDVK